MGVVVSARCRGCGGNYWGQDSGGAFFVECRCPVGEGGWQSEDPRHALHNTKGSHIVVKSGGAMAIGRVVTKGAANPCYIEFVSRPVYESTQFEDMDANDNWPDGWVWVRLP